MFKYFTLSLLLSSCHFIIFAQHTISGKFIDQSDQSPIIGVSVILKNALDSNSWKGTVTDIDGAFQFKNIPNGSYNLKATYIGYETVEQKVTIIDKNLNIGTAEMNQSATLLKSVTIETNQIRAEQIGDTTQYNADAFKTNPDASAENLITKMPGITVENGVVQAHGEQVKKVLVDGKEFFGDDATIALKNLPAEIIDKIQVFDKLSDQAQFTGFNDGNTEKTINIITKPGMNTGQFGRLYAGYGTDNTYQAGGNINFFNGDQRISIIGLSNNINQQNFSNEDILGALGSSAGSDRGRGGSRGGGGGPSVDPTAFLVGQQGGINTTNSLGVNYSDKWGKKINTTGSYFLNNSTNNNNSFLNRQYFLSDSINQFYTENNKATSTNTNHRVSMRILYEIDSSNSIILTPRLSFQNNNTSNSLSGTNTLSEDILLNSTLNNSSYENKGYNFSNNALYRHKFQKDGRTMSLNVRTDYNNKSGSSNLYALNNYYDGSIDSSELLDQQTNTAAKGYTLSPDLEYTEPVGKKSSLQLSYNPSFTKNASDKITSSIDSISGEYSLPDLALSSNFLNNVTSQKGGINYRFRGENFYLRLGGDYQNTQLSSEQTFPGNAIIQKTFNNLLTSGYFRYEISSEKQFRTYYRNSTNTPNISQLQSVIDNSNPLLLSTGNPDLKQENRYVFGIRYNHTNTSKAKAFFFFFNSEYKSDYIGKSTMIATTDTLLADGVTLYKGAQLSNPVNLDGYWNIKSFFTYGLPVKALKSNLNLNAGITYSTVPGLINNVVNLSNTYNFNSGFILGSNISKDVDFTLSYSGNYNTVQNSIQIKSNGNYFFHSASAKLNWLPLEKIILNTEVYNTLYSGLGSGFNQNIFLWNAAIGYKFLKNNAAQIRLSVFDILKQNNSISRTITETYIEDNQTQVLTQYYMLTLYYNVKNFKTNKKPSSRSKN